MKATLPLSLGFCFLAICCSGPLSTSPTSPVKPYVLPADFTLNAHAERGSEGEIYIVGSTNFPDGLKMWIHVESGAREIAGDDNVTVQNSRFKTIGLLKSSLNSKFTHEMESWPDATKLKYVNSPFPNGSYKVRFTSYFNGAWQTQVVFTELGGDAGKNLHGKLLRKTDPDVIDSEMILDAVYTLPFPPVARDAEAIQLVKSAVLTVPDRGRSATNIEANIELFLSSPGVSAAKGWSATLKTGTTYEVDYDFIDGTRGEQKAIWSADLS